MTLACTEEENQNTRENNPDLGTKTCATTLRQSGHERSGCGFGSTERL